MWRALVRRCEAGAVVEEKLDWEVCSRRRYLEFICHASAGRGARYLTRVRGDANELVAALLSHG